MLHHERGEGGERGEGLGFGGFKDPMSFVPSGRALDPRRAGFDPACVALSARHRSLNGIYNDMSTWQDPQWPGESEGLNLNPPTC